MSQVEDESLCNEVLDPKKRKKYGRGPKLEGCAFANFGISSGARRNRTKTETAKLIIQSSKDFGIDLNAKDNDGNTALHWACRFGLTEIAQLLIQSSKDFGIDLNAKNDNGLTALHEACIDGQTETVQLLIQFSKEFGIDLNAKDNDGWTALHWACNSGRTETIQIILKIWREFNIDIKAQNNEGKTALDFIDYLQGEMRNQIKEMLEKEYSRIDVTESVQSFE